MHAMFFGIKRVHLQTIKVVRALLRNEELTPARFDMMRILELHREWGIGQGKLTALLGVTAATVSRMLRALEELGFVTRRRVARDGRVRRVHITELGADRVQAALFALVDSGLADRMAERGLDLDPVAARPKVTILRRFLSSIRKAYGCTAPFEHPWTTSDLVPYVVHTIVDGRVCYGTPFEA